MPTKYCSEKCRDSDKEKHKKQRSLCAAFTRMLLAEKEQHDAALFDLLSNHAVS